MRLRHLWLALLMALLLALGAEAALAENTPFGVVNRQQAELRQSASTSAAVIQWIPANDWVAILGETSSWYYVAMQNGATGYVLKSAVTLPEDSWRSVGVVCHQKPTAYLNLRAKPNYFAPVLGSYHNSALCLLLSLADGWYHVRIEGVEGYFREEFIEAQWSVWSEDAATVIVPNGAAELRAGPGDVYDALNVFATGQYVSVLQKGNGWWRVASGGLVGFVNATYLRDGILSFAEIAAEEPQEAYVVVSNPRDTQVLNFREKPSTSARVLEQYRNGARLTLLDQGLEWCRVMNAAGEVGYMMTGYLTLHGVSSQPTLTVTHPQKSYVNLRATPSALLGAVLCQVPHGSQVVVLIPDDEWVKVRFQNTIGYMSARFLTR